MVQYQVDCLSKKERASASFNSDFVEDAGEEPENVGSAKLESFSILAI